MAIITSRRQYQNVGSGTVQPTEPAQERMTYPHPSQARGIGSDRQAFYEQMFQYYSNSAFDEVAQWARYKRKYNLYRWTRNIYNPFARLVDFYSNNVYPGVLSIDEDLPHETRSAIPFSLGTDQALKEAIAQTWQWSNWAIAKNTMVNYAAVTGNCLVEVVDNVQGGNIRYRPLWPGFVKDFVLDEYGNLEYYELEYQTADENGKPFKFGKIVDAGSITYLKDGQTESNTFNPYPFIPAVWVKHLDVGSDYGLSALKNGITKLDELNSTLAHVVDHIHKLINSPRILFGGGTIKNMFRNQTADETDFDNRTQQTMLKAEKEGNTETLVGNLDPATMIPLLDRMIAEIESDYPEIKVYQTLREQNIVSGPGAKLQVIDLENALSKPAANYDSASKRLFQMGLAIGGWRANTGAWGPNLTRQQEKFRGFGFDSYNRGELDFTILPRPLFIEASSEKAAELQLRAQAAASVADFVPKKELYEMLGFQADEIEDMIARSKVEAKEKADEEIRVTKESAPPKPPGAPGAGSQSK